VARHQNHPGTHGQRNSLETERSWSVVWWLQYARRDRTLPVNPPRPGWFCGPNPGRRKPQKSSWSPETRERLLLLLLLSSSSSAFQCYNRSTYWAFSVAGPVMYNSLTDSLCYSALSADGFIANSKNTFILKSSALYCIFCWRIT